VTKYRQSLALVFALALAWPAAAPAQEKPAPAPAKAAPAAVIPLKVQVVVSRFQGEKKISSLPYMLSVNAGSKATLRMGAQVPVMMITAPASPVKGPDGNAIAAVGPIQYRDVGTNIDCTVERPTDDGRFQIALTFDDSSVYGEGLAPGTNAPPAGNPSFRSFRASDSLMLKDGQTAQFTTATDKVSGDVIKVDVTLTVVR
jgi:hypothetical protein